MNEKNLLAGLSYIDRKYIEEAEKDAFPSRKLLKKPLLIAAVIGLMVFLMGCAIAAMRLHNMTIDVPTFTDYWGDERSILSLQGFEGSKNYEAFQEWQQFLEAYDPDKTILYASNDFRAPEAYYSYGCYSWEMVEKAEEICEKYGLEPLGEPWFYRQAEHLFEAVGIESIFSARAITEGHLISGYCFQDGSFKLEGDFELKEPWNTAVGFNCRSVKKTAFDGVYSTIGDPETYDQWEYTRKDGTKVLLALRKAEGETTSEGRIVVDKEDCFVVIAAHGPLTDIFGPIPNDRAFMEDFCEAFDFTYTAQRVDPDKAYELECEEEPHTYAEWIEFLLTDEEQSRFYPDLTYALVDITGDGQEELLLRCGHHDFTQQQRDENSFCTVTGMRDGRLVHLVDHGVCYLCQGNVVEYLSPFEDTPISHTYERFGQYYKAELLEYIHYQEEDGKLYRQVMDQLVEISQADAAAIVAQYPHIEMDFKPAEEFRDNP